MNNNKFTKKVVPEFNPISPRYLANLIKLNAKGHYKGETVYLDQAKRASEGKKSVGNSDALFLAQEIATVAKLKAKLIKDEAELGRETRQFENEKKAFILRTHRENVISIRRRELELQSEFEMKVEKICLNWAAFNFWNEIALINIYHPNCSTEKQEIVINLLKQHIDLQVEQMKTLEEDLGLVVRKYFERIIKHFKQVFDNRI